MPRGGRSTQLGDKCTDCGCELTKHNFVLNGTKQVPKTRCRPCFKAAVKKYPANAKAYRARVWIEWKYKIPYHKYTEMKERQLGGCAICKQPCASGNALSVDHDHKTGETRDLLCWKCNIVLGHLNDDEDYIFNILEYLKRHSRRVA